MIRHIRFADLRPEPWRNGSGSTVELARSGGTVDFDWRISIATIAADGPFSTLAGIDRCLVVLDGSVVLACGPAAPVRLDARTAPFCFDGGTDTVAALPDGPAVVLNIMTRNGQAAVVWRHGGQDIGKGRGHCFVNTANADTTAIGSDPIMLEPFDALLCDDPASDSFSLPTSARGIWIELPNHTAAKALGCGAAPSFQGLPSAGSPVCRRDI